MSFGLNTVSAIAVLDLRQVLLQLGAITTDALPALGLTDTQLLDPEQAHLPIQEQRIDESHFLKLWQLAAAYAPLPHIGLLIGQHYQAESRGLLANWLFQCDTLQQSLEVFIKHIPLMNPSERWHYSTDAQNVRLYIAFDADRQYPPAAIERSMSTLLVWCQELTGKPVPISEVTFSNSKPGYQASLTDTFGKQITYNHPYNSILLPRSYLAEKILTRNPYIEAVMQEKASHILTALQQDNDLVVRIQAIIRNNLNAPPDIHALAKALGLSRATLYRQLKNRGTNYSTIVTDIQKVQAKKWLLEGESINAISIDLGFADSSAFYKAFKRWYGITPTEFRNE
ncbi:AraC family transcriptional regulator [Maricurvus nonylphenolicus]|uniref:AraC family transcriptional regulator n=1 Tax=Maricurvus nonylphenolicus TaxID=1008307 RepID=UPI0036F1E695